MNLKYIEINVFFILYMSFFLILLSFWAHYKTIFHLPTALEMLRIRNDFFNVKLFINVLPSHTQKFIYIRSSITTILFIKVGIKRRISTFIIADYTIQKNDK
jgi:hypothetical protein